MYIKNTLVHIHPLYIGGPIYNSTLKTFDYWFFSLFFLFGFLIKHDFYIYAPETMENIEHFLNWKKRGYFHYFYSNISLIGTFGNQICNSFTKGSFEFLWTDPLSSNINWFVYIRDFVSLRFETFKLYAFIHIQHLFLYKCANFKFCEKKIFEKESFPREYLRTDIFNRNMEIILILVVKK